MFENINGVEIKKDVFNPASKLQFYTNSTHRVSIIYSGNGTGKSTVGRLVKDISLNDTNCLVGSFIDKDNNTVHISEDACKNIYVLYRIHIFQILLILRKKEKLLDV